MIRHGVLVITLLLSVIALLLCVMAESKGSTSAWTMLSVSADYMWIGWILRVSGGIVAGIALLFLFPVRAAVRQKSLAGLMAKASLVLSLACILWEVAVPLVIVIVVGYGVLSYFSDDGSDGLSDTGD